MYSTKIADQEAALIVENLPYWTTLKIAARKIGPVCPVKYKDQKCVRVHRHLGHHISDNGTEWYVAPFAEDSHIKLYHEQTVSAALREERDALRQAQRWIPVEEGLPPRIEDKYPQTVLFVVRGQRLPEMGWWVYDGTDNTSPKRWTSVETAADDMPIYFDLEQVTHWMPLPKVPEAERVLGKQGE